MASQVHPIMGDRGDMTAVIGPPRLVGELDKAVALARTYALMDPDTLVVVTGDHECGGQTVEDIATTDEFGDGTSAEDGPFAIKTSALKFNLDWTTTGHPSADVPITAYGG
jgi:alkaline phosphatase